MQEVERERTKQTVDLKAITLIILRRIIHKGGIQKHVAIKNKKV